MSDFICSTFTGFPFFMFSLIKYIVLSTVFVLDIKLLRFSFMQYTVLEFQFRSVKYTVVTRLRKNFEQLFIPIQAIHGDYSVWSEQPTSQSFQTCLYYAYTYSNYRINQLLYCWQIIQLKFEAK